MYCALLNSNRVKLVYHQWFSPIKKFKSYDFENSKCPMIYTLSNLHKTEVWKFIGWFFTQILWYPLRLCSECQVNLAANNTTCDCPSTASYQRVALGESLVRWLVPRPNQLEFPVSSQPDLKMQLYRQLLFTETTACCMENGTINIHVPAFFQV